MRSLSNSSDSRNQLQFFRIYLRITAGCLLLIPIYYFLSPGGISINRGIFSLIALLFASCILLLSFLIHDIDRVKNFLQKLLTKNSLQIFLVSVFCIMLILFLLLFISQPYFLFTVRNTHKILPIVLSLLIWGIMTTIFACIYLKTTKRATFKIFLFDLLTICVILVQHLLIFKDHYFHDFGFPWDFPLGYYAVVANWTSLVTDGVLPRWMPFQQMGYPIDLYLQSGLHYPLFWLFPLFRMPYDLNSAVVFQTLHILFGTLGMYALLRGLGIKPSYALLGAVAFHFFGGFFSNSEHPDIVRAYSITPWVVYSYSVNYRALSIPKRITLIPLFVFLMATGGYPGNFIAVLILMVFYCLFQIISMAIYIKKWKHIVTTSMSLLFLTTIGLLISFFHLGPGFLEKEYLFRYQNLPSVESVMGLGFKHFPSLFLTNAAVPGEVSMTSLFITLPIVILIFFVTYKYLRSNLPIVFIGLIGLLLAIGPESILWLTLRKLFSFVSFSRFPSSDYRIFIVILGIILAIGGMKSIVNNQATKNSLLVRSILASGVVISLMIVAMKNEPVFLTRPLEKDEAIIALTFLITTLGLIWTYSLRAGLSRAGLIIFMGILIFLHGLSVIPTILEWQVPQFSHFYADTIQFPLYDDNGDFNPESIHEQMPNIRPGRVDETNLSQKILGYVAGKFLMNDLTGNLLANSHLIKNNQLYYDYMSLSWTPILIPPDISDFKIENFSVLDKNILEGIKDPLPRESINLVAYSVNEIMYQVNLSSQFILVENEVFFPGWQATLIGETVEESIQSISVNQLFRGWILPAGNYKMTAFFEFPNHNRYIGISLLSVILWFVFSFFIYFRIERRKVKY